MWICKLFFSDRTLLSVSGLIIFYMEGQDKTEKNMPFDYFRNLLEYKVPGQTQNSEEHSKKTLT